VGILTDCLQTAYRLLTDCLQTAYRLLTDCLQTAYRLLTEVRFTEKTNSDDYMNSNHVNFYLSISILILFAFEE